MATEFTYSISGDTQTGVLSSNRLAVEIEQSSIVSALLALRTEGDALYVSFASDLSSADETTLDAVIAAHSGDKLRDWTLILSEREMEPVVPGASKVVANDRPAIEIQNGVTGYAALQAIWPLLQYTKAELRLRIYFILKATGTGSNVRIAARMKAQGSGEDSSAAFTVSDFTVAPVTFTTIGEVFVADVILDASSAEFGDAIAAQIGRDGANDLGSGTSDDVNQAIQIIGMQMEAR